MYNRNYLQENSQTNTSYSQERATSSAPIDIREFLRQTYRLFASSLLAASVGAYLGMGVASTIQSWYWGFVILEIALLFGLYAVKNKPGINLAVLFAFTFVSGLVLAPLLTMAIGITGGAGIIGQAFLMTSVAFGGISYFAMTTTKDYTNMGKFLFIALIILVVGSISNIFIGSSILQLGIAMFGALLFSAFILYDTQNIIKGNVATPIEAAIALYLDFLNLFVSLLQILMAFAGNNSDD